ncbi:MAG TPA: hypothetical protein VGM16_00310, partial [Gammaproteobacteria bacterium]
MKLLPVCAATLVLVGCAASPPRNSAPVAVAAPAASSTAAPSQIGIGKITLGMPLDKAMAAFGSPGQLGTDDKGAAYHAYPLTASGGYTVLMTAIFRPTYVYGIQVAGGSDVEMDPVMGLKLGDTSQAVLEHVGAPSSKTPVTGMDRSLWSYVGRNYSFEVDSSGHLVSILVYGYEGVIVARGWPAAWERYQPDSIAAVIEHDRPGWDAPEDNYYIAAGGVFLRPRVRFTGEVRPTSAEAMDLMDNFFKTTPGNLTAKMYPQSIKVVEDGNAYWLP